VVTAEAESQSRVLAGRGESQRTLQIGLAEATVLLRKIASFGDPRLYALQVVAEKLAKSEQPLVPERVFVSGGAGEPGTSSAGQGMVGMLLSLLVAEKSGFQVSDDPDLSELKDFGNRMSRQAMESMEQTATISPPKPAPGNGAPAKAPARIVK
jgi:hypothetical protein